MKQKIGMIVFCLILSLIFLFLYLSSSNNVVTIKSISYLRAPHIMTIATDRPSALINNLTATIQPNNNNNNNNNNSTSESSPTTTAAYSVPTSQSVSVQSPSDMTFIDPRTLNESGFIEYSLGVSPLSDMKLIGHRVPEKIFIPVDISDIYFSVKTASFNSYRQQTVFLTWAQTVAIDQIFFTTDKATNWTDAFAARGYQINTAPHCGLGHTDYSLCCKSGVEYDQFYKAMEAGRNFSWMCHIDDDEYMNVWKLKRMLIKYDPNKPWYIGKSHHEYWKLDHSRSVNFPEAKRQIYKFNTGNVYCLSKQTMIETEKYFRGRNFIKTCEKAHWIDDVTIAIVFVAVLGYEPTEEKQMWSHYEVLDQLPKSESLKMINFGYGKLEFGFHGRWNTSLNLPNPRFSYNADPTRFLSYHCMMYPKLKWC